MFIKWLTLVNQKDILQIARLTVVNLKEREKIDMDSNKIMLQPSEWIIMEKLWEVQPKTL